MGWPNPNLTEPETALMLYLRQREGALCDVFLGPDDVTAAAGLLRKGLIRRGTAFNGVRLSSKGRKWRQ